MKENLSAVLAGIGGYGEFYLSHLLGQTSIPLRLAGAADPAPQRCSRLRELEEKNIPVFHSLEAFYDAGRRADLAIIASPHHFHAGQTCLALSRGSHVLCEKPLCPTVEEAEKMLRARDSAGKTMAAGFQWSFSSAVQKLKKDILDGVLGKPLRLKTLVLGPRPRSYYTRNGWAGVLRDEKGRWVLDSPAANAFAHFLHNMFYLTGPSLGRSAAPEEIEAELCRANRIRNFDTAAMRIRTAGGVEILFYCSHAVPAMRGPVFSFEFEKAIVRLEGMDGNLEAQLPGGEVRNYGVPNSEPSAKIIQTVEAIRTRKPVLCGIEAAASHVLCLHGLHFPQLPIADFPGSMIRAAGEDNDPLVWADNLAETLNECFGKNMLPSENAISWAVGSEPVSLREAARRLASASDR